MVACTPLLLLMLARDLARFSLQHFRDSIHCRHRHRNLKHHQYPCDSIPRTNSAASMVLVSVNVITACPRSDTM